MKDLPFELVDSTSSLPFEVVGTIAPPPVAGLTDSVGNLPGETYNPLSTAERERPTVDPNWYAQATPEQRRLANRAITEAQGQWNPLQEAHNDIAGESLILDGMPASGATERVVRRAVTGTGGLLEKLQRNAVGDWEGLQRATEHKLMAAQGSANAAESWVEGIAGGAAESLSKAAMFAPLGGPAGIIAAFVYDSTTDALEEARQAGLEGDDIAKYAAGIGVLEGGIAAAFQAMGLGGFESMFKSAGWGGVKEASKQMLAEVAEEEITAFSQAAISVLEGVNPDALRNPGQLAIDTAAATVLAMGTVQGSKAAVDFVNNPSRRTAKAAGVDGVAQNQKQRDKLTADAKKIIEHKQYAEGFRQQLADVAEAGRMTPEQARYLYYLTEARAKASGESLGEYLQSRGVRVENAKWEDFANKGNRRAIDESQSLGHPAYHGSPYKFDKFTLEHIGSGEGAQAYGWGLYFAGNESVARFYREKLSHPVRTITQRIIDSGIYDDTDSPSDAVAFLMDSNDFSAEEKELLSALQEDDWLGFDYPHQAVSAATGKSLSNYDVSERTKAAVKAVKNRGSLYKVDLKPTPDDYLLWDKPFSEQSEKVKAALREVYSRMRFPLDDDGTPSYFSSDPDGDSLYTSYASAMGMGQSVRDSALKEMASIDLRDAGIRGIKYLDGSSRSKGDGSYNYVIFDDADIVIEDILAQRGKKLRRNAEIEFAQDGQTIIRAFETATFNSMIHELGHLFRRDLAGKEMDAGARWAGAKKQDGEWVWSRDAEEKFARGFERYMTDGTAPSKPLGRLFEKIAGWMRNVYASLRREAPDVNISPEMRGVYDSLFLGADVAQDAMQAAPATETQATPGAAQEAAQEPTASLADEALLDRFRGLANHSVNPVARAANYAVDEAMGMPDRKTWADAEAAARQRIQADPAGELQRALAKIAEAERTDGTVDLSDMTETAVFNRLKEAASLDIANPESRRIHKKIHESFRKARTEQARALGYRDPLNTPQQRKRRAITDAIATMDDDAEIQKIIDKLKGMGIDLTDLDALIVDPHKTMITLDHFRKSQKFSDKLYEYWRNAILSGPRTQVTNIAGNTVFAAYKLGPERLAESLINVLVRDKKAAQLGEFKYMLAGVWPGIQRGVRNAVKAWSLETSSLSEELGAEAQYKVAEGARGAIPGKLGRFIRAFGYRPLLAADEFSKSITVTMEAGAHAYRAGKQLGLEGEQLSQFIAEQVDDLSSPVWDVALEKAHELAFQSDRGVVTSALSNLGNKARSVPGIRWVVPFVQTPASIVEEGLRMTPVLGAVLDYAETRRQGAGIADLNLSSTLARQAIALAATAILWDAVDDDDGWITGAAQANDPKSREAAYRGQPPQSIKIGDAWYSYARIEPFATAVSFVVDTIRGAKYGGTSGAVREALYSPGNQIQNKSFLEGLSSLQEFVEDFRKRDEAAMARFAGRFATSFMPNIYRQIMSADTPEMNENRVWGKAPDVYKQILKRVAQQSQIPGVDTTQRYDLWGRPIQYHNEWNDNAIGTVGSFLQSLLSPIRTKRVTSLDEVDRALLQWNSQHPEEAVVWSEPPKYDRYKGETHYLSDEQYAEFAELAGTLAAERVLKMNVNDIRPTKHQIEKIKDAVTRGRAIARSRLRPKWRESWSGE